MSTIRTFGTVVCGALVGMILGGGFGYGAGRVAPDLFAHVFPWEEFEPVGTATVLGAAGGVFCGAFLAGFALLLAHFTRARVEARA